MTALTLGPVSTCTEMTDAADTTDAATLRVREPARLAFRPTGRKKMRRTPANRPAGRHSMTGRPAQYSAEIKWCIIKYFAYAFANKTGGCKCTCNYKFCLHMYLQYKVLSLYCFFRTPLLYCIEWFQKYVQYTIITPFVSSSFCFLTPLIYGSLRFQKHNRNAA